MQRFYTTWNGDTLRMAWTGANWNDDGDLFIYLDSGAGGATTLDNPYPTVPGDGTIGLPAGFTANYMVWVKDRQTATLLRSSGSTWQLAQNLDETL